MRTRLMLDVLAHEGVDWVALIGPDALPIDFAPKTHDVDSAVAMWTDLDFLVEDTPARMLVRTSEALMISHRVDEDRLLLIHAGLDVNVGMLRNTLESAAQRIIDLA
ncbi:MAG: hypothetical protein QF722_04810 [Candidatus Thalassarchaeaceae archaeon]|nr:hypothetical protein [Candidatus Thalassarchaeaceae archaeon]MDP6844854.1 hypothetical protein [Candidatus Thalassarchaeaceae archaeon]